MYIEESYSREEAGKEGSRKLRVKRREDKDIAGKLLSTPNKLEDQNETTTTKHK